MATTQKFKMLPSFYKTCLQASLTQAQYLLTLQILILLLQSHGTVQLERLAALTFPAIFLIERSLAFPLSRSPILSLVIIIKISLLTIGKSLKPLFCRRFQT